MVDWNLKSYPASVGVEEHVHDLINYDFLIPIIDVRIKPEKHIQNI